MKVQNLLTRNKILFSILFRIKIFLPHSKNEFLYNIEILELKLSNRLQKIVFKIH